jgi:hypothetical protein
MRHPHQNIKNSTRHNSTDMAPIDDAFVELELLEPSENFLYRKIAAKYSVVRSILTRRYQGLVRPT